MYSNFIMKSFFFSFSLKYIDNKIWKLLNNKIKNIYFGIWLVKIMFKSTFSLEYLMK
jgi:hypothetical protein